MPLKTFKTEDLERDFGDVARGGQGVSAIIREELKDVPAGNAIMVSELTEIVSEKTGKSKEQLGPQVRQTAARLGKLLTRQTPKGKRTFLIISKKEEGGPVPKRKTA